MGLRANNPPYLTIPMNHKECQAIITLSMMTLLYTMPCVDIHHHTTLWNHRYLGSASKIHRISVIM